jgi:hypothetical protein
MYAGEENKRMPVIAAHRVDGQHQPGPRGKSIFSAGFHKLTDTGLGKEEYVAADHMLLIGRIW